MLSIAIACFDSKYKTLSQTVVFNAQPGVRLHTPGITPGNHALNYHWAGMAKNTTYIRRYSGKVLK
jgi:hypothetical protein